MSRIWLINGALAVGVMLCLAQIWDVWRPERETVENGPSGGRGQIARTVKTPEERRLGPSEDYRSVVDRNLFSPERKPPSTEEAETPPVAEETRVSGEKVTLYGVVILGEFKTAMINNISDEDRERRFLWVREGDKVGDVTVQAIAQDQVTLADSEGPYRVLLYDPEKKPASGVSTPTRSGEPGQPQVISVGEKPKPAPAKSASGSAPSSASSAPAPGKAPIQTTEDGQYQIIQTPFGEIKRKIK